MKRIISALVLACILSLSVIGANASESISFDFADAECKSGRLVEVAVVAKCSKRLCAATFEITYDKAMLEFRSVKTSDSNATVKANELENTVKAVYLNENGADISDEAAIFTITFKAVNSGTGYIDFTVSDCVDEDVNWLDVGKCTSSKITVTGSTSSSQTDSKSTKSTTEASKTGSDSKTSEREAETDTEASATIDNLGLINPINDSGTKYLALGIIVGAAFVILLLLMFFIGKRVATVKAKSDEKSEAKDKSKENDPD